MNAMKLFGMVSAFENQLSSSEYKELSFEERAGLLVDAEWTDREQRKLSRRLRAAKLRYPACLENVNFQASRGLNREQILSLGSCRFVGERHNLLITGPTGIGKSFLACAFVERACRRGFTACYMRAPRLVHELAVSHGDGSYARLLTRLAKLDLLAIDDWLLHPLKESERRDLMEVIEDRAERGSTLIANPDSDQAVARSDWRPKPSRCHLRSHSPPRAPRHSQRSFFEKDQGRTKSIGSRRCMSERKAKASMRQKGVKSPKLESQAMLGKNDSRECLRSPSREPGHTLAPLETGPTSAPRLGRGRLMPTGTGRSLRVFLYARSLRHQPAAHCSTTRR